jgi:hypothetical protein
MFTLQNTYRKLIKEFDIIKPGMIAKSDENERAIFNDLYAITGLLGSGATE